MNTPKTITSYLYKDQAEEAARFYTGIFPGSQMGPLTPYPESVNNMAKGSVLTAEFIMFGRSFIAINCGGDVPFSEGVSTQVLCETQDEIDFYWDKLLEGGGKEVACGWLKDKFGMSWQITPSMMKDLLGTTDREKAARVMREMMTMKKMDIARLKAAYEA